jgi:hypothetical protein
MHFLAENEILISLPCRQAGNFEILNNIKLPNKQISKQTNMKRELMKIFGSIVTKLK